MQKLKDEYENEIQSQLTKEKKKLEKLNAFEREKMKEFKEQMKNSKAKAEIQLQKKRAEEKKYNRNLRD